MTKLRQTLQMGHFDVIRALRYCRCPQDTTMEYTYYPTANSQQFKMRSFRFFNDYDVVFFHCELLACYRYSYNSRYVCCEEV